MMVTRPALARPGELGRHLSARRLKLAGFCSQPPEVSWGLTRKVAGAERGRDSNSRTPVFPEPQGKALIGQSPGEQQGPLPSSPRLPWSVV